MRGPALPTLPQDDLDRMFHGLDLSEWQRLAGRRFFFTGGTGFLGKWMLSSLLDADRRLGLGVEVEVLTRRPEAFAEAMPWLATAPGVRLLRGDVRDFELPSGPVDVVIHGATDVVAQSSSMDTFLTCVEGTRRVLARAQAGGARDFLLLSSGAVYGPHPSQGRGVAEDFAGAPDPTLPASAYGEGKRASEWLACAQGAESGLRVKIARIYAQVGPYLPLDKHFAIGNFIRDAMAGREVLVQGDGTATRSYLHAADTVTWLWAMLLRGLPQRAWNVGGEEAVSIAELAHKVSGLLGSGAAPRVLGVADPSRPVGRYLPDVRRARSELRLPPPLPLDEAIMRTARWIRHNHLIET